MHPDEAVQIAIQELRSRTQHTPPPAARPSSATALLRSYLGALSWYVADGRTPVADEETAVGHLPRVRFSSGSAETALEAALAPLGVEVGR